MSADKHKVTNLERIRHMDVVELAKLLVHVDHREEFDYDWDEEPYYWGQSEVYITTDGRIFEDEEEAINYEVGWLTLS